MVEVSLYDALVTAFVSEDGSPLSMYLALPADDAALFVERVGKVGCSVLELGSGPGRTTRLLIALGHEVTAVDDSQEMLAHVTGAATVCADLFDLELGQRFDVVLAASHLINRPGSLDQLLAVCHRHVTDDGVVLIERYEPGWLESAEMSIRKHGPVEIEFEPGKTLGSVYSGAVTYRLGEQEWVQRFKAEDVDDATLTSAADQVGLAVDANLTDDKNWVALRTRSTRS